MLPKCAWHVGCGSVNYRLSLGSRQLDRHDERKAGAVRYADVFHTVHGDRYLHLENGRLIAIHLSN
jgi:hypothetical protein